MATTYHVLYKACVTMPGLACLACLACRLLQFIILFVLAISSFYYFPFRHFIMQFLIHFTIRQSVSGVVAGSLPFSFVICGHIGHRATFSIRSSSVICAEQQYVQSITAVLCVHSAYSAIDKINQLCAITFRPQCRMHIFGILVRHISMQTQYNLYKKKHRSFEVYVDAMVCNDSEQNSVLYVK